MLRVNVRGQGPEQPAMRSEAFEFGLDDRPQSRFQVFRLRQSFFRRGYPFLLRALIKGQHEGFFGVEVVVRSAQRDPGLFRDVSHRCFSKASLMEQTQRSFQDSLARLFRFFDSNRHFPSPGIWFVLGGKGGAVRRARFLIREKTKRLKKCIPPRTSSTTPILSLTSSIDSRTLARFPVVLRARAT